MPCPYANVLGMPNQGVHANRFHGFAINDILGLFFLAGATSYSSKISFMRSLFAWFAVAEILHYSLGVRTAFLDKLGISRDCSAEVVNKDKGSGGQN